MPARFLSTAHATWVTVLPLPQLNLPGVFLAAATRSARLFQGELAGTYRPIGLEPMPATFSGNSLAAQLKMVARLIAGRSTLGNKRQVFMVSLGGFDLHDNLISQQPVLMDRVSKAMTAFYEATVTLGLANKVTAFTASDFGRTLASNGDGSDHGWGSHHLVAGGAVRGGSLYGSFPTLVVDGPDDAGNGCWIPTSSVDQYAATLARWFGVDDARLDEVLPNLRNFATRDLGFMNS